jgi:hypothetical protein
LTYIRRALSWIPKDTTGVFAEVVFGWHGSNRRLNITFERVAPNSWDGFQLRVKTYIDLAPKAEVTYSCGFDTTSRILTVAEFTESESSAVQLLKLISINLKQRLGVLAEWDPYLEALTPAEWDTLDMLKSGPVMLNLNDVYVQSLTDRYISFVQRTGYSIDYFLVITIFRVVQGEIQNMK